MVTKRIEHLCRIEELPFTVAPSPTPHNPNGLPDILPFNLDLDCHLGLLVQARNSTVMQHLDAAYRTGSIIGSAMDDTGLGRRYADDFLSFIAGSGEILGQRILEIGAGRGYLVRQLAELGGKSIGLEPGAGNAIHWQRHQANVVADYFPSAKASGPFDAIIAYGVLEHVPSPATFIAEVCAHLAPGGRFLMSVPDCAGPIAFGDPSMLVHEHFSYFTEASLRRTLEASGLGIIDLRKAGFGGALYAAAKASGTTRNEAPSAAEMAEARAFGGRLQRLQTNFRTQLDALRAAGRCIGIYCPARVLALLDSGAGLRFFDDDPELQGKFYPPFECAVEPRRALLDDPVDELWIMSRTFGPTLRAKLAAEPALKRCRMRLPDDLLPLPASTEALVRE